MKEIFYKLILFLFCICFDVFAVNVSLQGENINILEKIISKRDLFLNKNKDIHDLDDVMTNLHSDIELIKKKMRQNGFFDAIVKYSIRSLKRGYSVIINVNTGNRYKINKINCDVEIDEFKYFFNNFLNTDFCIADLSGKSEQLLSKLREIGYKDVFFKEFDFEKNEKLKTIGLTIKVNLGGKKYFGKTTVVGNKKVNTEYIKKIITWKEGDVFNISVIKNFERELLSKSLFKSVNVKFEDNGNNEENVIVEVSEQGHHILEFGGRFATSNNINYKKAGVKKLRGVSIYSSWTHLNLLGNGELFRVSAEGMPFYEKNKILEATSYIKVLPEYSFYIEFTNPPVKNDYSSNIMGKVFQIWTTRYIKKSSSIGIKLQKNNQKENLKQSISFDFENYDLREFLIKNFSKKSIYKYLNTEYIIDFDCRDNTLDATKGIRGMLTCSPYISLGSSANALKLCYSVCYFFSLKDFILVPWVVGKTVLHKKNNDLPCDKLLYSGGVNSLRGYYTNFAGEVIGHIPIGGKSVSEFGLEVRKRISKSFGLCLFYESAKISQKSWHMMSGNVYSDFGVGVRYYSIIGPIRIDLAFPKRVRKFVDSKCQLIVALGQSF